MSPCHQGLTTRRQSADSPQEVRTSPSGLNVTNGRERWNPNTAGRGRRCQPVPYVRTAIHELPLTVRQGRSVRFGSVI